MFKMAEQQGSQTGGAVSRRTFVAGAAAGAVVGGAAVWGTQRWLGQRSAAEAPLIVPDTKFGLPGRYPGKVIEVHHSEAAQGNKRNRPAVKAMLDRGLKELVG